MRRDPIERCLGCLCDDLRPLLGRLRAWLCGHFCPEPLTVRCYMAFSITESTTVTATVKFKKPNGQPARVDGVPVWAAEPGLTISAAADGLSCSVTADALPDGTFTQDLQITCTGDADLGPGVRPLMLTGVLTVTAAEASGGDIEFS
jgi:hypothetical protein